MGVTSPKVAAEPGAGPVDDATFAALVAPLRRELHAHCYRMLGSSHDADDALQDALLRAWRGLPRFEGRGSLRSWLYTVATRTCLDLAAGRGRRALPVDLGPASERAVPDDPRADHVAWLGPYPDGGLAAGPALLLFDVLGFSAAEIAAMLGTSTTAVNSALARARRVLAERVPAASQQRTLRKLDDARLREVVTGYATALENGDADALIALLTEDVTWSMPPMPHWYRGATGRRRWHAAWSRCAPTVCSRRRWWTGCGSWRHLPTNANGQPAVASYLRQAGTGPYLPWSINVLTLRDGRIAEITSFLDVAHFPAFGLPPSLPPTDGVPGSGRRRDVP